MNARKNDYLMYRAGRLAAPAVLLLLVSSFVWARSSIAVKEFNEGVKFFNAKQFSQAITHFDATISNDADFTDAYFARGACKYYLKSLDGALLDLNDALRLKPDHLEARALRGAVDYESDHWDAALEDFNYVLDKNPREAQSLLGRAVILLKREDIAGAERDFKGFLRVRPDDALAPKVRQIVASLRRGTERAPAQAEEPAPRSAPEHTARAPRRAAPAPRAMSPAEIQRLVDSLMAHPLSDPYNRKVLHGESAQAVGDIHSVPGVPGERTERRRSDPDVQIVEPQ